MAGKGTGSLLFTDHVIAETSSKINSEVFRTMLPTHIQPNAKNLMGNDCKFPVEAIQDILKTSKWNILQWPNQAPVLIEQFFSYLKQN